MVETNIGKTMRNNVRKSRALGNACVMKMPLDVRMLGILVFSGIVCLPFERLHSRSSQVLSETIGGHFLLESPMDPTT